MRVRHRRTRRLLDDRTLQVRKPGLGLPISLPSIPIVSPLLAGHNGNGNGNGGSGNGNGNGNSGSGSGSQPPPSPATTPAQTPPTSGGTTTTGGSTSSGSTSSGGATSGGSTGGSTSGGSSGGTTSSGSSGGTTSSGSSGGTTSGGSTGGSTPVNGPAAVGGSTPGGSSGGSAGGSSPSPAGTSNGGTPSSAAGSTSTGSGSTSDGTPGTAGSGTGSSDGTSPKSPSPSSSSVSSAGGSANAGNLPGGASDRDSISAVTSTITDSHGHAIATTIITPSASENPSSSSVSPTDGAAKSGHLSTGGIAAIAVILFFFGLGMTVILLRKRWVERRHERRNRWWFARRRTSQNYDDNSSVEFAPGYNSTRSSFATTLDHANIPNSHLNLSNVLPPVPAMAQIRHNPNAPTLVLERSHLDPLPLDQRRFSIGSAESHGSTDTQFLVVHHRDSLNIEAPLSSSRPFSNSESFAFPKPPPEAAGSRPSSSAATLPMRSPTQSSTFFPSSPRPSTASNYPTPPASPIALLTPPSPASGVFDPFSDKNGLINSDPFADQHPPLVRPNHSSFSSGEFSEIETIRRPFVPTREDEVGVEPNEQVRILQLFDDGWTKVEKVNSLKASKGKVKVAEVETGLIPIDCLRESGVDLPTFFDKKRISGYTSPTKSTFGF